jgi:hypothetical protein
VGVYLEVSSFDLGTWITFKINADVAKCKFMVSEHRRRYVNFVQRFQWRIRVEESIGEAEQRVNRLGVGRRFEPSLVVEVAHGEYERLADPLPNGNVCDAVLL